MFYPIKLYFKHLPHLIILPLSLALNLVNWVWLLWKIRPQVDPIFLHYNILFGVDYVGEWWRILFLPLAGLLIFLINGTIAWIIFSKNKFAAELLNFAALLCQIFLLVAGALLVFLNV
jgi:hypothetical protein